MESDQKTVRLVSMDHGPHQAWNTHGLLYGPRLVNVSLNFAGIKCNRPALSVLQKHNGKLFK